MSHKNLNIVKELMLYLMFKYSLLVADKKIEE